MKIDCNTSQAELEKLYAAIVRQEFLRGTPLNLRQFLRYTLLFMLFPGMIFGFWVGLGITGAFCAALLALLLTDNASWGVAATCSWICLGLIPAAFITWDTLRRAKKTRDLRMQMREPQRSLSPKACVPDRTPLKWRKKRSRHGHSITSSLIVNAPADGLYAFFLSVDNYSGARLTTDGPAGVCTAESSGKPGETFNALLIYRLKQGQHQLSWTMRAPNQGCPQAVISQLNGFSLPKA